MGIWSITKVKKGAGCNSKLRLMHIIFVTGSGVGTILQYYHHYAIRIRVRNNFYRNDLQISHIHTVQLNLNLTTHAYSNYTTRHVSENAHKKPVFA